MNQETHAMNPLLQPRRRGRTWWVRFLPALALLAAIGGGPGPAAAQSAPAASSVGGSELMADMLLRLTLQTLSDDRGQDGALRPDQVARAQVLLDMALELAPDDAELWARRVNLAEQVGDDAGVLRALRRLVELRPDQDAYHLRLIMHELTEVETLDGRLAVLEDHLSRADAEGFSEPLRSRVASAAAAAAREMGDTDAFLKHLKTAVRADSANGEAAGLTYQLALDRQATPKSVASAAINLVRARPLDSDARLILAQSLANVGVFDRAAEQFNVASRLPRATPISPEYWTMWSASLIAAGQTREAEAMLSEVEKQFNTPVEEGGIGAAMPMELELQRRVMHGDDERGRAAYDRAVATLQAMVEAGNADAKLELAWVTALLGPDTQAVADMLDGQLRTDPRYLRATGFMFMREGAERWARQAFEQIAETDHIGAYGLALLQGRDDAGRARFLRGVLHDWPGTFGGLLAANQLHEMNRDVMPGAEGRAVTDAMNRLPISLWRFDVDRNPWTSLRAQFEASRTSYLEPIHAKLVIQNGLDIPLPIDPATGLGTSAFVSVSAYSGGQSLGQLPPIIADLGGRLTLGPRERWETDIRIDRSMFGLLLTTYATSTLTYNTTFLTNPRYMPNGALIAGPLGGIDTVRSVQAFVPTPTADTLQQWSNDAVNARGIERYTALSGLARLGDSISEAEIDRDLSRACIEALIKAYETAGPNEKAWTLLLLKTNNDRRSAYQTILDQGQRSDDPLVRIAYLIGHTQDPDDQALTTAIRDGAPAVQRFAEGLRDFLRLPPAEPAESAQSAVPTP